MRLSNTAYKTKHKPAMILFKIGIKNVTNGL